MAFDPTHYEKALAQDEQREPGLPDDEWKARFIASMIADGNAGAASPEFQKELPEYAAQAAESYLPDRHQYITPEEAADTDISYWESEE